MYPSDADILELLKQNGKKEKAFNLIVQKYQKRLYNVIFYILQDHESTNDVLQETLIRVWNAIDNFRQESNLYSWLYRIASNQTLTHINKEKKRKTTDLDQATHVKTSGENVSASKLEHYLQQGLLTLPEKQRIVFVLRYYDQMPYETMSEVLGTSVGALKASYHHAAQKIEKIILNLSQKI